MNKMIETCEMCGSEKEIIGKAVYLKGEQKICRSCLLYAIPKYTVIYQKEMVPIYRGDE